MPTALPGIFSFRAKMARIFGLKLVLPAVMRCKPKLEEKSEEGLFSLPPLLSSEKREKCAPHACAVGQNKREYVSNDDIESTT